MALDDLIDMSKYMGAAEAPGAAVTPAATKLPFYKRPISLRALLGLGGSALGMGANVVGGALALGAGAKAIEDRVMATNDVSSQLTPEFQRQTEAAGGYGAYAKSAAERTAGLLPATTVEPVTLSGSIGKPQEPNINYSQQAIYAMDNAQGAPVKPVVAPPVEEQLPSGFGGVIAGMLRLRQAAAGQTRNLARQKLSVDALGKLPGMRRDAAAAALDEATLATAQAEAARGGTPGAVAGVLGRRAPAAPDSNVFFPGLTPKDPVIVGNKQTGAVTQRQARPELTDANIQATMKARKLTREQAIAAYAAEGYDTSRLR